MQKLFTCTALRAIIAFSVVAASLTNPAQADDSIDLKVEMPTSVEIRITSDYKHEGKVLVVPEDSKKGVETLKLAVDAKLGYQQRMLSASQAIRIYDTAHATIELGKGKSKPKLSSNNDLVVARSKSESQEVEMAAVKGALFHDELELIQNPADPLTLAAVLNKDGVKVGDKWTPNPVALAKLLSVQKILESDLKLSLKSFDNESARVFIAGSLSADVDDVTTQMDVSGIAIINRRSNLPTSFKISMRETKQPGQIAPGFEGLTKIDLRFTKAKPSQKLSNTALANHTKNGKIRQRLKWVSRIGQFKMLYDPRWKMITESEEASLLRYLDKTSVIAQCQAVILPNRPASKPLSLDAYKKEISKIVETDKNAKFVKAATNRSSAGNTVMSVIVSGVEEGVEVQWFYYNVAKTDGRQVAFVFTLEGNASDKVLPIAKQLVDEFEFSTPVKKVAKGKSAKPTSSSRKR